MGVGGCGGGCGGAASAWPLHTHTLTHTHRSAAAPLPYAPHRQVPIRTLVVNQVLQPGLKDKYLQVGAGGCWAGSWVLGAGCWAGGQLYGLGAGGKPWGLGPAGPGIACSLAASAHAPTLNPTTCALCCSPYARRRGARTSSARCSGWRRTPSWGSCSSSRRRCSTWRWVGAGGQGRVKDYALGRGLREPVLEVKRRTGRCTRGDGAASAAWRLLPPALAACQPLIPLLSPLCRCAACPR